MEEQEFFMVWEPSSGRTQYRHASEEAATIEAQRLCRQTDHVFYVLKAVGRVAPAIKPIEVFKLVPPPQIEAKDEDIFSDSSQDEMPVNPDR